MVRFIDDYRATYGVEPICLRALGEVVRSSVAAFGDSFGVEINGPRAHARTGR